VSCITGNGLKTTDVLQGAYEQERCRCGRGCPTLPTISKNSRRLNRPCGSGICQLRLCCPMPFRSTPTTCVRSTRRRQSARVGHRHLEGRFPALRQHLRGEDGQVRKFINFYVNEEDIRFLGNEKYAFQDGDEVLVIPSIAGG
jgi:molybdopterin converting factor small subunit